MSLALRALLSACLAVALLGGCRDVFAFPDGDAAVSGDAADRSDSETRLDGRADTTNTSDALDAGVRGDAAIGAPCRDGNDCASGQCGRNSRCTNVCSNDFDCPYPSWECVANAVPDEPRVCACTRATFEICDGVDNDCNGTIDDNSTACPGGTCRGGRCECADGMQVCAGRCVDLRRADTDCGACGTVCRFGASCSNGVCLCPSPTTMCGNECVDLRSHRDHCGTCETVCPWGGVCRDGACSCVEGWAPCRGVCTDLQSNALECGACGHVCGSGEACAGGHCVCVGGRTACADGCVDTTTDIVNCGGCGVVCPFRASCASGSCRCPDQTPTRCGDECVDLQRDADHCGTCDTRCPGSCVDGVCASIVSIGVWGTRCVALSDGRVRCGISTPFADVPGIRTAVRVAVGGHFVCALLADGHVECWGEGTEGQLGNGAFVSSSTPVAVAGLTDVVQLSAGGAHACARTRAGMLLCWGSNTSGQLGDGTTTSRATPVAVPLDAVSDVDAGAGATCAVRAGAAWCWGYNAFGIVGDDSFVSRSAPSAVVGIPGTTLRVRVGGQVACAVNDADGAWCWGSLTGGSGVATATRRTIDAPVVDVAAGDAAYAVLRDGRAYAWTDAMTGTAGGGLAPPYRVGALVGVTMIDAGFGGGCALTDHGELWCWGDTPERIHP